MGRNSTGVHQGQHPIAITGILGARPPSPRIKLRHYLPLAVMLGVLPSQGLCELVGGDHRADQGQDLRHRERLPLVRDRLAAIL